MSNASSFLPKFKNISLLIKLYAPLVLMILLTAGGLVGNQVKDRQLLSANDTIAEDGVKVTSRVSALIVEFQNLDGLFYRYLINQSTGELQDGEEKMSVLKERAIELRGELESFISDYNGEDVNTLKEIQQRYNQFVIGENNDGIYDIAIQMMALDVSFVLRGISSYSDVYTDFIEALKKVQQDSIQTAEVLVEQSVKNSHQFNFYMLVVSIVSTLIVTLLSFAIIVATLKGIKNISASTEQLAEGNIDIDIEKLTRKDELGGIVQSLLKFKENQIQIRKMKEEQEQNEIKQAEERKREMNSLADQFEMQVADIVRSVAQATQEMQGQAKRIYGSMENIDKQSQNIGDASNEATMNVTAVSGAAEELSSSIREISSNVHTAADLTRACAGAAQLSQENLNTLQNAVAEIDTVIQAINNVAEQTNLLALNATIEAARAGEAGRGFAVVANEVKSLAGATQKMTDEIAMKVDNIKDSANDTITSVNDILKQISEISEQSNSVAAAIEEQNNSTLEISSNINQTSSLVQNVSNLVDLIQQSSSESSIEVSSLQEFTANLSKKAQELQQAVDEFIVQVRI